MLHNISGFKISNILLAYTLLICIPTISQCQNKNISTPESYSISSDSLHKMDNYFHKLVDENKLAGIQTGIIHKGEMIHFDTYGHSNIEEGDLLNDESIFRIYSMTKPIVTVGLMQLYDQGKFALYDPISKYIPSFEQSYIYSDSALVPALQPIRIIDILTHTAGFSYGNSRVGKLNQYYADADLYSAEDNMAFVEKLSKIPLEFEPGTNWQYGLSTNICGYLIEVLSGKTLDNYLRDEVLIPLEMHDTHFQLPMDKTDRFTIGYGWEEKRGLYINEDIINSRYINKITLFNAGGGMVSTTYDYLKFCQMILNRGSVGDIHILKKETIDLMLSDHMAETRKHQERLRLPLGEASFGLGFAIRGENPESLENVFGWGGALGTYFKVDMDHDLAFVMMVQLSPHRHLGLRAKIQNFVDAAIIN